MAAPPKLLVPKPYAGPLFLALIAAGLAGNFYRFPIFANVDFLFGSIFAMLALQCFGIGRGMLAAAIIASSTYIIWHHPYAILSLTAEVVVVGWLMARRRLGMVIADALYWLVIGLPLVYLFSHVVMHVPRSNTNFVVIKQVVNGISNALVARLIFTGFALRSRAVLMSFREIGYNLLSFFVLCPTVIILALGSRTDLAATKQHIYTTLLHEQQHMELYLRTWVSNRQTALVNLAERAARESPPQMQPLVEQATKSDLNFLRVGLLDKEATVTAYYPLFDEQGRENIGKNVADRPYLPFLKKTLKPLLSEMVIGQVGAAKPIVMMLVPVVMGGEYGGYIAGTLRLQQIQEHFAKSFNNNDVLYTLLDINGNIIMTNRSDQKVMTPLNRGVGTLTHLTNGIRQWVPLAPADIPIADRWPQSFYIAESNIGDLGEWKLILEQSTAPFQKTLYESYTTKLTILFLVLLVALVLAEVLSRRLVGTMERLRHLSRDLPIKLAAGTKIDWPTSGIIDEAKLIANFREMADSLSAQFIENRQTNQHLEQRVEERTRQLSNAMSELNIILENAPICILKMIDRMPVWVNRKAEDLFLYSKAELEFQTSRKLYPSDEAYERLGQEAYPALAQGRIFETVQELIRKDGTHLLIRYIGKAIAPPDMAKGTLWLLEDCTERQQAEEAQARSLREKTVMLKEIHHRVKNNLTVVYSLLSLQAKKITDQTYRFMFEESKNRVMSMAMIHEKLYQSPNLAHIDFKKYLQVLVAGIFETYQLPNVTLVVEMEDLALDVNVGIPCGLIVNELVSNSLKYAFPEGRQGVVTVGINRDRGGRNVLTVQDNGIGFPPEVDFRSISTSLGLQLVQGLTDQIHGTIDLTREGGTRICITFPGVSPNKG